MNNINHIENLIKGSIVGQLIGDALGYPYANNKVNHNKIEMIEGLNGEAPGTYQGPGALSLCIMASINECNAVVLDDIMERFNDFVIAGFLGASEDCSDISEITIQAIKNYMNGMPPDKCGLREYNDNECLTRMLPIGLYFANSSIDILIEQAHAVCKLTHAQIESQVTCAVYCLIIKNILLQKSEKVFDLLRDYYKIKDMPLFYTALEELKKCKSKTKSNDKSVENCFWSAWSAYSSKIGDNNLQDDFKLCITSAITSAITSGNDVNSIGAVTGGIVALTNGLQNIPTTWLNAIILSSEVMETIIIFIENIIKKIKEKGID